MLKLGNTYPMLDFINNANFMQSVLLLGAIGGCPTSPLREGEKTFFCMEPIDRSGKKAPSLKEGASIYYVLISSKMTLTIS